MEEDLREKLEHGQKRLDIHRARRSKGRFEPPPILATMKPEQEIIQLKDLLGNFSDQTGASFG